MAGPRWQPFAVAAALLAPPVALAVAVWPASASSGGDGGGDGGALAVGEEVDGQVVGAGATTYELTAEEDGPVRIDVLGRGSDPTLTVVDVESGDQLGFNDDSDGVDSSLVLDLDAGQVVRAEVRSFGGTSIAFTIRASAADEDELDDGGDGGFGPGGPGPGPTVVEEGATEAFSEPLGDEEIEVEGPGGVRIRLYEQDGMVCMDVELRSGGSGTCGPDLASLAQPGGFGGSSDGRTSTIDVVTLVGPDVAAAVAVHADGEELTMDLVPIPGRAERVVVGQIRMAGDAFSRPGGSGWSLELRDGSGDVIQSFPA